MKTKLYTASDLEKAHSKGGKRAIDMMLLLCVWALMDELNADEKQINKVIKFLGAKSEIIADKTVGVEDIRKMIKDETGIVIRIS